MTLATVNREGDDSDNCRSVAGRGANVLHVCVHGLSRLNPGSFLTACMPAAYTGAGDGEAKNPRAQGSTARVVQFDAEP